MEKISARLDTNDKNFITAFLPINFKTGNPIVIVCGGWESPSGQKNPFIFDDIGVVVFDYFGCGKTGGDSALVTHKRYKSNLEDVFDWVCEQKWSQGSKIGTYGSSAGTVCSLRFAQDFNRSRFAILTASCNTAFVGMPNSPAKVLAENLTVLANGGTASMFGVERKSEYFTDFIGSSALYAIDKTNCPVLILQGKKDNIWRQGDAYICFLALKKAEKQVKYIEFEDGDHSLGTVARERDEAIYVWLKEIGIL